MISVVVLATADWGHPLWTNKQYVARELSSECRVIYVNSLGLRRPQASARDLKRIVSRLRGAGATTRPIPPNLSVLSPWVFPIHRRPFGYINGRILQRIQRELGTIDVLWTFSPVTYGWERHANATIYHSVDLLGEFPGIDADLVDREERRLAKENVIAIASSTEVERHLRDVGFGRRLLWHNVGDVEPFAARMDVNVHRSGVVFGGNISPHKVDLELVAALRRSLPDVTVTMAGPVADGGGKSDIGRSLRSLGVELPGVLSTDELAALYAMRSVGIIPYRLNSYTAGVSPLKLYEYLAAGLPVVSTPIPAVVEKRLDGVAIARTSHEFTEAIRRCLDVDDAGRRSLSKGAATHSWARRGEQARALVQTLADQSTTDP